MPTTLSLPNIEEHLYLLAIQNMLAINEGTLSSALMEMAVSTAASLAVEKGRLWLTSGYNPSALPYLKAIPERTFDTPSKRWSFPLTQFQAVYSTVMKHYPDSKMPLLKLARETAEALKAPPQKTVKIEPDGKGYRIFTPYSAAFVADFKAAIPQASRKWINADKCWWFSTKHLAAVLQIATTHFGADAIQEP